MELSHCGQDKRILELGVYQDKPVGSGVEDSTPVVFLFGFIFFCCCNLVIINFSR